MDVHRTAGLRSLRRWAVALAAATSVPLTAQAQQFFHGRVLDTETSAPIALAIVSLVAEGESRDLVRQTTDSAGRYRLRAPRAGRYVVQARRVGFSPLRTPAYEIRRSEERLVDLPMTRIVASLDTVVVAEETVRHSFMLDGFMARRALGVGTFFDREALEARGFPPMATLLREVPGLRISSSTGRTSVRLNRGGTLSPQTPQCVPGIILDGVGVTRSDDAPESTSGLLGSINGREVEAVEIYKSRSQVPAEFAGPEARCGAILIWTSQPGLSHQRRVAPAPRR